MLSYLPHSVRRTALTASLLLGLPALAADPSAAATGVLWLDWATEQVAFALREALPADTTVVEAGTVPPADPLAATHSIETIEIHRLQQEIFLLRQLIEQEFVCRIIALESEIRDMKYAVQAQGGAGGDSASGPVIPRPAGMPLTPRETPGTDAPGDSELAAAIATQLATPEAFSFTIVDEWGRSPEVAAELGGDASTLIGVAGLVPPRSAKADVVALLRELRATYEPYDNINIEIFDSEAAARAYAERQVADPDHHVASISRHKASGRDVMIYLAGGQPETVPMTGSLPE